MQSKTVQANYSNLDFKATIEMIEKQNYTKIEVAVYSFLREEMVLTVDKLAKLFSKSPVALIEHLVSLCDTDS